MHLNILQQVYFGQYIDWTKPNKLQDRPHLPESVTENVIFAQDGNHLEEKSDDSLLLCLCFNQSCSNLIVLDNLQRSGDNKAEAVNAFPSVVEKVPWRAAQQSLNQI